MPVTKPFCLHRAAAMHGATTVALLVVFAFPGSALLQEPLHATSAINATSSPIRKVVTLIQEMKVQVEKDAKADEEAYDKYACWCETTKAEKEAAVKNAQAKIEELEALLEEAASKEAQLKTEIADLEGDIAEDQDAVEKATSLRSKEHEEFVAEEKDLKECIGALKKAIDVLAKVQLLQRQGKGDASRPLLLELQHIVQKGHAQSSSFRGAMQQDLWDVLGSLESIVSDKKQAGMPLAPHSFLHKKELSAIEEHQSLLPWEKTDEEIGMAAKPNDLVGAAAGAKSYNSRSGSIFGVLSEMQDEFARNLAAAQREELDALIAFQHLRAAKEAEIEAATRQKEQKEAELADLLQRVAQAKEDLEATKEAMASDQQFLIDLEKSCTNQAEEYASRVKARSLEITAIAETLTILTADDSRDLFGKTISFLQVLSRTEAQAQQRAKNKAVVHLFSEARKNKDWVLASLAVRAQLDSFSKVKVMMDKMVAELKEQQKAEYEKWEFCKQEIDKTEDSIKEATEENDDLHELKTKLENTIATLTNEITQLKEEVAATEISLKIAGKQRKEENLIFQASVSDQRATIQILQKAQTRLQQFYNKGGSLAQLGAHQEPGAPVAPPPPTPAPYSKTANAGGVMQLLAKIIADAAGDEAVMVKSEQSSQESYAVFAKDTANSIQANRASIMEKTEASAKASADLSATEEAILGREKELATLADLLKSQHLDCDFLLKYFDIRQKARTEEMDSIVEAKAILSGADFGAAPES